MITGMRAQRIIQAGRLLVFGTTGPDDSMALQAGARGRVVLHLFVPLDLIPDRIPILGHVDEAGAVLSGLIFSYLLIPPKFQERGFIAATDRPSVGRHTKFLHRRRGAVVGQPRCLRRAPTSDVFGCPIENRTTLRFRTASVMQRGPRHARMLMNRHVRLLAPPLVALVSGYDAYLDLFRGWRGQRGGRSVDLVLPSPVAAGRLPRAALMPGSSLSCDPLARAYSDFLMLRQIGHEWNHLKPPWSTSCKQFGTGSRLGEESSGPVVMQTKIRRYLERFPRAQLLFVMFDELVHEPEATLQRVFRHLRVDPEAGKHIRITWQNKSRSVRVDDQSSTGPERHGSGFFCEQCAKGDTASVGTHLLYA